MTGNLTRAEAADRARLLKLESYRIELDLHVAAPPASGRRPRSDSAAPGRAPRPDHRPGRDRRSRGSRLNGRTLPQLEEFDGHRVRLLELAGAANELTIEARCACSHERRRLAPARRSGRRLRLSLLQPRDRVRQPGLGLLRPARSEGHVRVHRALPGRAGRSSRPQDLDQAAQPTDIDGVVAWHFPPTPPMSTYYHAPSRPGLHHVRASDDGRIPLALACRQSLATLPGRWMPTPHGDLRVHPAGPGLLRHRGVRAASTPSTKYDQIFVPGVQRRGRWRTPGAVTILRGPSFFRSRVTEASREARAETCSLHELAHMWFGDLVTAMTWCGRPGWLNESFATWASIVALAEATRWPNAWTTFSQFLKAWAYRQDQLPSTHPIVADIVDVASVEVFFDGITYAKGAAVLKQLVAFVGQENFLTGLRAYFDSHAWGNATLADLLDALEQASGRQLQDWSKAWLETAGVNTLRPHYATAADGAFTEFAVLQSAAASGGSRGSSPSTSTAGVPGRSPFDQHSHPVLRPHRIAIGLYEQAEGKLHRRQRIEVEVTGERTEVPALIGAARPDLVLVNDDDLTYAEGSVLDDHSLRAPRSARSLISPTRCRLRALCLVGGVGHVPGRWRWRRQGLPHARAGGRDGTTGEPQRAADRARPRRPVAVRRYADPGWRPARAGSARHRVAEPVVRGRARVGPAAHVRRDVFIPSRSRIRPHDPGPAR